MGIKQRDIPDHWNYFLLLEDDLLNLSRWIEFNEDNFNCYSIELVRLLLVASSEVDVVAKMLCNEIDDTMRAKNIIDYQQVITSEYQELVLTKLTIPRFGLTFQPWHNWQEADTPPLWWKAHTDVKHQRQEHFNQATLRNVLNSITGLLVLLSIYYGRIKQPLPSTPKLIEFSGVFDFIDDGGNIYFNAFRD